MTTPTPTPTPEPARAEPVGGDTKRLSPLFAASVSSDGRPALQWIGHGRIVLPEGTSVDTLADFVNRIVDMERPVAPAPASDAGLAEVAATVADYEAVLADKRRLTSELDVAMHGERGAAAQASLCDLIEPARKMAATIAALHADNDRLRADAAGRAEGVVLDWHVPTEDDRKAYAVFAMGGLISFIGTAWHSLMLAPGETRVRPLQWEPTEVAAVPGMGEARDRARIAAAPAPATDGTGGGHHG